MSEDSLFPPFFFTSFFLFFHLFLFLSSCVSCPIHLSHSFLPPTSHSPSSLPSPILLTYLPSHASLHTIHCTEPTLNTFHALPFPSLPSPTLLSPPHSPSTLSIPSSPFPIHRISSLSSPSPLPSHPSHLAPWRGRWLGWQGCVGPLR